MTEVKVLAVAFADELEERGYRRPGSDVERNPRPAFLLHRREQTPPPYRSGAQEQHRGLFAGGSEDLQFGRRVQVGDLAYLSSGRDDGANLVVAQGRGKNPAHPGAHGLRCADVNCRLGRRRRCIEGEDAEVMRLTPRSSDRPAAQSKS